MHAHALEGLAAGLEGGLENDGVDFGVVGGGDGLAEFGEAGGAPGLGFGGERGCGFGGEKEVGGVVAAAEVESGVIADDFDAGLEERGVGNERIAAEGVFFEVGEAVAVGVGVW